MTTEDRRARRAVEKRARAIRKQAVEALDACDDLLDDGGEALSLPERASLKTALAALVLTVEALDTAKALTGSTGLIREVTG